MKGTYFSYFDKLDVYVIRSIRSNSYKKKIENVTYLHFIINLASFYNKMIWVTEILSLVWVIVILSLILGLKRCLQTDDLKVLMIKLYD